VARLGDAWARLSRARVAILGSTGADGVAHLVPCCFAVDGNLLYSAVDDKPKVSPDLQRLANVALDERVTVMVHHYDEDWEQLWWIRASGTARVVSSGTEQGRAEQGRAEHGRSEEDCAEEERAEHDRAVTLLLTKYPQYATHHLDAPVLAITVSKWRTWAWR
jgi:PPOX class probable F420-dependent enzyme